MSATQASAVTAILFQLMTALDNYSLEAAQLGCARVDPKAYHRMRLRLDEMRRYAHDVPGLSASSVELLIRHLELAHVRWKIDQSGEDCGSLQRAAAEHGAAVQRLRAQCGALLRRDASPDG